MDADTQHHFEKLLGYIIRTDARFMALEMTIAEVSRHTEKQKEAFRDKVDKNFEVIYEIMLEQSEDVDPALAARLLGEYFPKTDDQ